MISHLFKRNGIFWFDARDDHHRWRESLATRNRHEAEEKLRVRLEHLEVAGNTTTKPYRQLTVKEAIQRYAKDRRAQVSPRTHAFWLEQITPLDKFFSTTTLKQLTPQHFNDYQNLMLDAGYSPAHIDNNLRVLRQVLKHAKLLYRFTDYKRIPNTKKPVGRALTEEELQRLYFTAKSRPQWQYAATAATLAFVLGMRRCEIRNLKWSDIDFTADLLDIKKSKTKAGYRTPPLNDTCRQVLLELYETAEANGHADPNHYLFPRAGKDPTRPMQDWRSAWRSIRKAAGLGNLRFHDGRHTAITRAGEKNTPEHVMLELFGDIDRDMLRHYFQARKQALRQAVTALEPGFLTQPHSGTELIN